jgi:hypothetical protein
MSNITLKTLESFSPQEVFEYISTRLIKQNKRCADKADFCMYRDGDLRCAAGFVIADDEYDAKTMETSEWLNLVAENIVPAAHSDLIASLQYIHDSYSPGTWGGELAKYGIYNGLNTSFLNEE